MRLSHLTALAVMIALVGAMFVALAPARAHDLGECSNPEYLIQADCEVVDVDHDDNDTTPLVARGTWMAGTHTAANHPPTLSITVLDSDGIVGDDTTVSVLISVANIHIADPTAADPVVEVAFNDAVDLEFVRVSGELEGPATDDIPNLVATGSVHDDNSAASAVQVDHYPGWDVARRVHRVHPVDAAHR